MKRIALLTALTLGALALGACSESTAPTTPAPRSARPALHPRTPRADWTCRSGYETSTGFTCTDSSQT